MMNLKKVSPSCCYYCDYATCKYNGKNRLNKKQQPHMCPMYHKEAKAKYHKTKTKRLFKTMINKSLEEIE